MKKLSIKTPKRKNLPTLGISAACISAKDEEDVHETNKMEMHAEDMRKDLSTNVKRDKMRMK